LSLPLASVMLVKSDVPVLSCYVLSYTLYKIQCSVCGRNMVSLPLHVIDSFSWKSYIYVINFIEVMNVCSQFECLTHCILVFAQKQYLEFEMWCCRAEDWLCIFFKLRSSVITFCDLIFFFFFKDLFQRKYVQQVGGQVRKLFP